MIVSGVVREGAAQGAHPGTKNNNDHYFYPRAQPTKDTLGLSV